MKTSQIVFKLQGGHGGHDKNHFFNIQKHIIPKLSKPVLWFLSSARRLIVLFIFVKFHENMSKGFQVT